MFCAQFACVNCVKFTDPLKTKGCRAINIKSADNERDRQNPQNAERYNPCNTELNATYAQIINRLCTKEIFWAENICQNFVIYARFYDRCKHDWFLSGWNFKAKWGAIIQKIENFVFCARYYSMYTFLWLQFRVLRTFFRVLRTKCRVLRTTAY